MGQSVNFACNREILVFLAQTIRKIMLLNFFIYAATKYNSMILDILNNDNSKIFVALLKVSDLKNKNLINPFL